MKPTKLKVLSFTIILIILTGCSKIASRNQEFTINKDIPYAAIEGVDPNLLNLVVYAPAGANDLPVVLMIHGGGWANGDKDQEARTAVQKASLSWW